MLNKNNGGQFAPSIFMGGQNIGNGVGSTMGEYSYNIPSEMHYQ